MKGMAQLQWKGVVRLRRGHQISSTAADIIQN